MSGIMGMIAASGPVPTVSIAPPSQFDQVTFPSNTFAAETVTVVDGIPTAYNWYFTGIVGGTWNVNSGQGTAAGVARVTFVTNGDTVHATFNCDVTVNGVTYTVASNLEFENLTP